MTRDEKRMIRREWINHYLQLEITYISNIKRLVRFAERYYYSQELAVYHG